MTAVAVLFLTLINSNGSCFADIFALLFFDDFWLFNTLTTWGVMLVFILFYVRKLVFQRSFYMLSVICLFLQENQFVMQHLPLEKIKVPN